MPVLTAQDIHKSFATAQRSLHILKGVNLELEPGSITALRGPSGSGKSTLLNILGTLDSPDRGKVLFGSSDLSSFSDDELSTFRNRNIGFIFQFHHLLPELNLWENLVLPMQLNNARQEPADIAYIEALLNLTGLDPRREHFPSQLSGGERQRVAVIRALVNKPGIVLADEPTGNLDMENGAILLNLIEQLRTEHGQTFLIATHSENLAKRADRRLYLRDGVINVTPQVAG